MTILIAQHDNADLLLHTLHGTIYEVRPLGDDFGPTFYDIKLAISYHDSLRPTIMRMPSRIGFIKEIRSFMSKETGVPCDLRTAKEIADAGWPIVKEMVERANRV